MKSIDFPQYRRYKNHRSYFKINSFEEFEEYKYIGKKLEYYLIKVKILPDRNYLNDLLFHYENYWEKIDAATFQKFISRPAAYFPKS